MKDIVPKIDINELQKKANEFAQNGAIATIKDFYTGYNSPYKKSIEEHLQHKGVNHSFDLPDIVAALNDGISKEIDKIANAAIAETFIPMAAELLTRAPAKMNFSEVLKKFIEIGYYDWKEYDSNDFNVEISEPEGSFMYLSIFGGDDKYEHLGLHNHKGTREEPKWSFFTLPRDHTSHFQHKMKLTVEGAVLEMPFVPSVLHDRFKSFIASLIIAKTEITFDVADFNEDMFPQDECHC